MTSAISGAPAWYFCTTVPHRLMLWVHPHLLQVPFRVHVPRFASGLLALAANDLPGLPSSSRHEPMASTVTVGLRFPSPQAFQACFVPSATFRTSSTVSSATGRAGLFHPAATSRIHSPGVLPLGPPYELVARRCPLVVDVNPLPLVLKHRLQESPPRLQGFHRAENPLQEHEGLAHVIARSPRELSPSSGLSPCAVQVLFQAPSVHDLSRSSTYCRPTA